MFPLFDTAEGVLAAIVALLVDVSVKATFVMLFASLVAWGLRNRSAAARHAVWNVALGAVLMLPVLNLTVPSLVVPVPTSWVPVFTASGEEPVQPGNVAPAVNEPPVVARAEPAALEPATPERAQQASRAVLLDLPAPIPASLRSPDVPVQPGVHENRSAGWTWSGLLVTGWWVGASCVLLLLGVGLMRVAGVSAHGRPVRSRTWLDLRDRIARQFEIRRPVTLVISERATTPFTWGARRPFVVLPADAMSWSADRRRQVLIHEMAHIRRNDFLTQLVARYACAVYWFHPFVWFAAARLRETREQACDDAVLASGVRPSTYAGHLLEIARGVRDARASAFATVAMARRSQLEGRLLALLDEGRMRDDPGGPGTALGWAAAFAILVPLSAMRPVAEVAPDAPVPPGAAIAAAVPADPAPVADDPYVPSPVLGAASVLVAQQEDVRWASAPQCSERPREGARRGTNENRNDDRQTTRWWDGDCEGEVHLRGRIQFSDDFSDVSAIARNGRFEIEIDDGDETRRVEMRSDGGRITRRWFVGGREGTFDAAARQWLAAALSDFFRHSSLELEARLDRLMRQGGVAAVLAEARRVHGDYQMGQMFERALASGQMSPDEINRVVQEAAREIESDYSLSRVLRSVPADALADNGLRRTYVQATDRIDSDYEKRQSLQAILTQPNLSDQVVMDLLETSRTIDSDYELATLLRELGTDYLRTAALRSAYLETARSIDSDYELRRVLSTLLENDQLENAVLLTVLETSAGISSDHELTQLLLQTSTRFVVDDGMRPAFFRAVGTLGSDHERGRILKSLMENQSLSQPALLDVIESASAIGSDFQLAELLREAGARYLIDDNLRTAFFRALGRVGSDHERQRVITTLAKRNGLSRAVVLDLVQAARAIGGDFSKAASLIEIHRQYGTDEQVRTAIEDAAGGIGSDYEYGRVMSAVRGRRTER